MAHTKRHPVKYLSCRCRLLKKTIWAILTRQSSHRWKIVNCLDKDKVCSKRACAFTTDGGVWPFGIGSLEEPPDKELIDGR